MFNLEKLTGALHLTLNDSNLTSKDENASILM